MVCNEITVTDSLVCQIILVWRVKTPFQCAKLQCQCSIFQFSFFFINTNLGFFQCQTEISVSVKCNNFYMLYVCLWTFQRTQPWRFCLILRFDHWLNFIAIFAFNIHFQNRWMQQCGQVLTAASSFNGAYLEVFQWYYCWKCLHCFYTVAIHCYCVCAVVWESATAEA